MTAPRSSVPDDPGPNGEKVALPDGSVCVVERRAYNASIVSREVDGRCVWGQAFSRNEDHEGQVDEVVAKMTADPAAFHRWWLG